MDAVVALFNGKGTTVAAENVSRGGLGVATVVARTGYSDAVTGTRYVAEVGLSSDRQWSCDVLLPDLVNVVVIVAIECTSILGDVVCRGDDSDWIVAKLVPGPSSFAALHRRSLQIRATACGGRPSAFCFPPDDVSSWIPKGRPTKCTKLGFANNPDFSLLVDSMKPQLTFTLVSSGLAAVGCTMPGPDGVSTTKKLRAPSANQTRALEM